MKTTRLCALVCAIGLLPVLSACKRNTAKEEGQTPPPAAAAANDSLRVSEVDVGRSIATDKRITDAGKTDEFSRGDTIYASVATEGTGNGAKLSARWTFEDGQVVDESSQTVASSGPAVTEFHISKPDGWPVGKYQVEILLNGQSVKTKDFQVK